MARGSDGGQPWRGSWRSPRQKGGACILKGKEQRRQGVRRPGRGPRDGEDRADAEPQRRVSLAAPGRRDGTPAGAWKPSGKWTRGRFRARLQAGGLTRLLAAAALRRPGRHTAVAVAQLDGVPALCGGSLGRFRSGFLGVSRRLDVMGAGPCPAFFRGKAAAARPALLGGPAAARVVLAGERLVGVLVHGGGQGDFERGEQIEDANACDKQAVSQGSPELEPRQPAHGGPARSRRRASNFLGTAGPAGQCAVLFLALR
jgi:hypothetical protein